MTQQESMLFDFRVDPIKGGFKMTGVCQSPAGRTSLGEAYASTRGQIPVRIKELVEGYFADGKPESTS